MLPPRLQTEKRAPSSLSFTRLFSVLQVCRLAFVQCHSLILCAAERVRIVRELRFQQSYLLMTGRCSLVTQIKARRAVL